MEGQKPWWCMECPPLGKIVQECIVSKERANRRSGYVAELKRSLGKFLQGRECVDPRDITPSDIESFFVSSGYSIETRATMMTRIATLFSWAQRKGYVQHNPVERLERVTVEQKPPQILGPGEANALLLTTERRDPGLLAYVTVGMLAGVRPNEMDRLSWSDIDTERAVIRIDACASKTRKRRLVPLHPKAVYWLAKADKSKPFAPSNKRVRMRILAAFMGWDEWPHDLLRHSCASYSIALHKDAGKVALALGNSVGVLLSRYHQLVSDEDCAKFWRI